MFSFFQDIRFAIRDLRKGFFVMSFAVLSLALAIAGNTTVFGFVNALLFRPLPYPKPDRIVLLGEREENAPPTLVASAANLRARQRHLCRRCSSSPLCIAVIAAYIPAQRASGFDPVSTLRGE